MGSCIQIGIFNVKVAALLNLYIERTQTQDGSHSLLSPNLQSDISSLLPYAVV